MNEDPEEFCRQHWRPLAQSLASYTGDVMLGQDLAQEALARVMARWRRVGRIGKEAQHGRGDRMSTCPSITRPAASARARRGASRASGPVAAEGV